MDGLRRAAARPTYLLLSAGFAGCFAMAATLNIVYQATVVGLGPLQLVLVGTVLELVIFVAEVPTGIVADLYSRRLSVLIGLVLIGAGFILEGAVPSFAAVLGAQVLWGVGYTFTSGARQAWIADEVGAERVAGVFVRAAQLDQAATIAGILAAGGLGLLSVRLPIIAGGAGFVLLAGVLALVMPEDGFRLAPASDRTTFGRMLEQFRAGLRLSRSRPVVRTLMLVSLIGGLASEAFDRLWVVHLLRLAFPFGAGPFGSGQVVWFAAIGLVGTLLSLLVSVTVNTVFPRALSSRHPRVLMAALAAVQVAGVVVFALAGNFWLAVSMLWLRTIVEVVAGPVTAAWMNRNLESGVRATVLSFESQLNAVGQVAGGPALGVVGNAFSVRVALLASAATLSPVIGLYAKRNRLPPDPANVRP